MSLKREQPGIIAIYTDGRRRYDPAWQASVVSACLEPGASVARLALEHGVNANLVWKWIQKHKEAQKEVLTRPVSCSPAFIPVQIEPSAGDLMFGHESAHALDLPPDDPRPMLLESDRPVLPSSPAKLTVSLPNGVKLSLECGDVHAVTAIIGALSNVQTVR